MKKKRRCVRMKKKEVACQNEKKKRWRVRMKKRGGVSE